MCITIEVNQNQVKKEEQLQLHFLPAKVHGDGSANVNSFFNNYIRKENNILFNALRGYPLQGVEISVPEEFKGLILQEPQNLRGTGDRNLRISGHFDKFTYWNYDKIPSKCDAYIQALKWDDLAAEFAKPVSDADVFAEMESHEKEAAAKENKTL